MRILLTLLFLTNVVIASAQRCGFVGDAPPPSTVLSDRSTEKLTIPVVVHVLWNVNEENISDAQIASQLAVFNADFNANNANLASVLSEFQDRIADVQLEFCLAVQDPDGNGTTGIERKFTPFSALGASPQVSDPSIGFTAWDVERYLNIWVADMSGAAIQGRAITMGSSGEPEGIIVDPSFFGTVETAATPPYHLGRVATHELGHYFGLQHPWGSSITPNCNEDDGITDTPLSAATYAHLCPQTPQNSCNSNDAFQNFMYYTDDACLAFFTEGQKQRMRDLLATVRPNLGLNEPTACSPFSATVITPTNQGTAHWWQQNGVLYVDMPFGKWSSEILVLSILGQPLISRKGQTTNWQLPVHYLPKGIYLMLLTDENNQQEVLKVRL